MKIQFTKHLDRPHTLTCIRDDGTRTWFTSRGNSMFFIAHDLTHYAVEHTLGLNEAFYGLIAGGRDIDDFGLESSAPVPEEAHQVEHTVNLISLLRSDSTHADYEAMLSGGEVPGIALTAEQLAAVRKTRDELLWQWNELDPEQTLELPF